MRRTPPKFYDEKNDLVQCQECGKCLKALGAHIKRMHKIGKKQYQKKYGLIDGDLVALSVRYNMHNAGIKRLEENPEQKEKLLKLSKKYLKKAINTPKTKNERTRETRSKVIDDELRRKMNEGIRKFAKSKKGKELYKLQAEKRKTGKFIKCKCGKEFYIGFARRKKTNYCSWKCKNIYECGTKEWKEKHKIGLDIKYKDKRIVAQCKNCQGEIKNIVSRQYKFCSWKCYKEWYQNNALTRQPNYYKDYYRNK